MTEIISIALLDFNKGQLAGLPKNPRFFRDYRYEAMKKSISDCPEMLELRELIVFPYSDGRYIVVIYGSGPARNLAIPSCLVKSWNRLLQSVNYANIPLKTISISVRMIWIFCKMSGTGQSCRTGVWSLRWKRLRMNSRNALKPLQMIPLFILLSPSTMKNMSSSLLYQVMRSIVIGCVKG